MKTRSICRILILWLVYQSFSSWAIARQGNQHENFSLNISSIPVVPGSKGDLDGNGAIEILDLIRARDISIGRLSNPGNSEIFAGDIDSDGSVTRDDVERIRDILLLKTVPPPTIFGINPTSARVGDQVTIEGAGFGPTPSENLVTFGGIPTTIISATTTRLTVTVPAGATSGNVVVTVNGQTSNGVDFQVTVSGDAPFISNVTPASALRGQEVTIEGERFGSVQGSSEVRFGDIKTENDDILSWSNTEIRTKVPTNAFPGIVTVTVNGEVSNGINFNVSVVEATVPDSVDIVETEDGISFVRKVVILDFKNNATLDEISTFLAENNLTQIGLIFRPRMIQARIDDERNPFDLAESLKANELLEGAFPSIISETKDVASESYPNAIGSTYNASNATFDTNLSRYRYHHFAMRTYAGHRLAEVILGKFGGTLPDVRVAIIDSGLGNGQISSPDEFKFRIKDPTSVGYRAAIGVVTGLTALTRIADCKSHGTAVAGFAAGSGIVSLGTGKHVNIRPLRTTVCIFGEDFADPFLITGAIEIAMDDPFVRVINLSLGSYEPNSSAAANAVRRIGTAELYDDEIEDAVGRGKIIVIAAGNELVDTQLSAPQVLAPDQPRVAGAPTIMNVAATQRASGPFGSTERIWSSQDAVSGTISGSNFGKKVSGSAPGDFVAVKLNRNYTSSSGSGTSFAAPLVSGLAAEMILLDEVLVRLGKRNTELSPEKIVNIIEKTADRLTLAGPDTLLGTGRINVWKALLATVNGGLSSEISDPEWYGFEIRASVSAPSSELREILADNFKGAQIYIDGLPLSDFGNTGIPLEEISLFKRVPEPQQSPGKPNIPIPASNGSQFLSTFSITKDEISGIVNNLKHLELRQKGKESNFPPFFELPLDLSRLRGGIAGVLSFDDFVYTIEIPRVIETKSVKGGNTRVVTDTVDGKSVKFPIGAVGDTVELSISYPEFQPVLNTDLDVEFFNPARIVLVNPDKVMNTATLPITNTITVEIPEFAETGPITVRTVTDEGEPSVSFSTLIDPIVARAVGLDLAGTNPGDLVKIAINVPHFTATSSNTRIKFPGSGPESAPDRITEGEGPDVTNVLETKIPDNVEEGSLSVILTVDDNQKVVFEGGDIVLFEKTDYAGTLTFTKIASGFMGQTIDQTPPPGKRAVPVRFTLNKTIEDFYFLSGSIENAVLALGPSITSGLDEGVLNFEFSQTVQGTTSELIVDLNLDDEDQGLSGSWGITASNPTIGISLEFNANIEAQVETEVAAYNGTFLGRPRRQSAEGDPELLESLELTRQIEFFLNFPFGFVQANGLTALTFVFQQPTQSGTTYASTQHFVLDGIEKYLLGMPAHISNSNDYAAYNYFVGTLTGNQFTFVFADSTRFPFLDVDPLNNLRITYNLSKNADNLNGTITLFRESIDEDPAETKTAQIVLSYSGRLQKEDEDDIDIIGIFPPPETGFPPVNEGAVNLTKIDVSYNLVSASEGTVVLRAFKNNNPTDVLVESELPVQLLVNKAGIANFRNINIRNVVSSVRTISIVAGLRQTGSTVFVVSSNVVSYSR